MFINLSDNSSLPSKNFKSLPDILISNVRVNLHETLQQLIRTSKSQLLNQRLTAVNFADLIWLALKFHKISRFNVHLGEVNHTAMIVFSLFTSPCEIKEYQICKYFAALILKGMHLSKLADKNQYVAGN